MENLTSVKLDRAVGTVKHESAAANVFTLKLSLSEQDEVRLLDLLNNCLPEDIFVMTFTRIASSFSAKTEPKIITYRYLIFEDYLNIESMNQAAKLFLGKQNFKRFLNSQYDKKRINPIIDILSSQIVVTGQTSDFGPVAYYEVTASSFFTNQVCAIVALIKSVGRGEKILAEIFEFLQPNTNDSSLLIVEPSVNLLLYNVEYKNLSFSINESNTSVVNKYIAGTMYNLKRTFSMLKCIHSKWENENYNTLNKLHNDDSL